MKNKPCFKLLFILVSGYLVLFFASCSNIQPKPSVIPEPVFAEMRPGTFTITSKTKIVTESDEVSLVELAGFLSERIELATGVSPEVITTGDSGMKNTILLITSADNPLLGAEGYELEVDKKSVRILANQSMDYLTDCRPSSSSCLQKLRRTSDFLNR